MLPSDRGGSADTEGSMDLDMYWNATGRDGVPGQAYFSRSSTGSTCTFFIRRFSISTNTEKAIAK